MSPPPPPVVIISPKPLPLVRPGMNLKLSATVQGATNPNVQWSSSNHAVAVTNAQGEVLATGLGDAWIRAIAEVNSRGRDSVRIVVVDTTVLPDPRPTVAFARIVRHNTSTPVDAAAVSGIVDIYAAYVIPTTVRAPVILRVYKGDTDLCQFSLPHGQGEVKCEVDTRTFANERVGILLELSGWGSTHMWLTIANPVAVVLMRVHRGVESVRDRSSASLAREMVERG